MFFAEHGFDGVFATGRRRADEIALIGHLEFDFGMCRRLLFRSAIDDDFRSGITRSRFDAHQAATRTAALGCRQLVQEVARGAEPNVARRNIRHIGDMGIRAEHIAIEALDTTFDTQNLRSNHRTLLAVFVGDLIHEFATAKRRIRIGNIRRSFVDRWEHVIALFDDRRLFILGFLVFDFDFHLLERDGLRPRRHEDDFVVSRPILQTDVEQRN